MPEQESDEQNNSQAKATVQARAIKDGIRVGFEGPGSILGEGVAFHTSSGNLFLGRVKGLEESHTWLSGFEGACLAMCEDRSGYGIQGTIKTNEKSGPLIDRVRETFGITRSKFRTLCAKVRRVLAMKVF